MTDINDIVSGRKVIRVMQSANKTMARPWNVDLGQAGTFMPLGRLLASVLEITTPYLVLWDV